MPELPEVETTKAGLEPHLTGKTISKCIVRCGKLRWPVDPKLAKILQNNKILSLARRAKYLLVNTNNGTLIIHLGMSGHLRLHEAEAPAVGKHDHIDLELCSGAVLRYNDPRRFGSWQWTTEDPLNHPRLAHLGPEPLSKEFNASYCIKKSDKRKVPIKGFIMNQNVVVGVGNIYASEALFLSKINPLRPANTISKQEWSNLCKVIRQVLKKSIKAGGTTLRDFSQSDGKPGYFVQQLKVYGQNKCPACKNNLTEVRIAQRNSFYCDECQN